MTMKKNHIMIIDDDLDIIDLVTAHFTANNITVTSFSDPQVALDKILGGFSCDAIITDLELPRFSGLDFTQKIKNEGIDIPVIVLTVNNNVETAMKAVFSGAYDFIVKPIHFAQLQISVERAIHLRRLKQDNQSLREILKKK